MGVGGRGLATCNYLAAVILVPSVLIQDILEV